MSQNIAIGKAAILLATLSENELELLSPALDNIKYCLGQVGSMNMQKVISAVETAAKRNGLYTLVCIAKHMHFIMQSWKEWKV